MASEIANDLVGIALVMQTFLSLFCYDLPASKTMGLIPAAAIESIFTHQA